MNRAIWMLFIAIGFVAGCSKSSTETSRPAEVDQVAENSDQAQVVRPSNITNAQSPASDSSLTVTIDSLPEEVCRIFIEQLRDNNLSKAEKLMTQKSILEARNKQLSLSSPVAAGALYHLGETQYATSKRKVAFVPCEVVQTVDGKTETKEFSMMLKSKITGWKIAGMLVQNKNDSTQDLLSFENPDDVAEIKQLVDPEIRQAAISPTHTIQ